MSNIDPKILSKIKKCLALSQSSNPNEAATALRQAHALMDKHGVSTHAITMSDIGEARAASRTMSRDKPAHWETRLAAIVGKAFGCQIMVHRMVLKGHTINKGGYIFVGLKHQAEVAAYTTTVLSRKCKNARQEWVKEHLGGLARGVAGGKAKMTQMGDMFAEGWVESISKLVMAFANPPEVNEAIEKHIDASQTSNDGIASTRQVDPNGQQMAAAAHMGMEAAKGERLYRPMAKAPDQLAITA